jgi:DNA-binding NarL/FixJ family response regulator
VKALLVSPQPQILADLRSILEGSAHIVTVVTTTQAAISDIANEPPDVAFVAWDPTTSVLPMLAQAIRKSDEATRMCRFVVAMVEDDSSPTRMAAYEAGADEIVRTSAGHRELVGLLHLAERIVRLEQRLHSRVMDLESALRRLELAAVRRGQALAALLPTGGAASSFLLSQAWAKLEEILTVMCNDYLGGGFSLVARAGLPEPNCPGASITLTDVEHELIIGLFFGAPGSSARAIATAFCGDPELVDEAMQQDVLLELANSGMGAVKAAFSAEKFPFAGAVPKPIKLAAPDKWFEQADAKRALAFHSDKATVHVLVSVRHLPRTRVPAHSLREGMVLANDVANDAGLLIARAGTRLTETTAEKIARLVPKKIIELADVS